MIRMFLAAMAVVAIAGPVRGASLEDCAGPAEISKAEIVRVEPTNDVLVLRDGRAIHLEGIRLPKGSADRAPAYLRDRAYDVLSGYARAHRVTIAAIAPKEDRYDRIRGQVFSNDRGEPWLQAMLLQRGLARVDLAPDRPECAGQFYAAERGARERKIGLWSSSAYAVRNPDALAGTTDTFQIVEGKVVSADVKSGRAYIDFGEDYRSDFTVTIAPEDMRNFRHAGVDPRDYEGKRIRVRGIVQQFHGPEIEIANPAQIEILN